MSDLERKIDQILHDVNFIKNRLSSYLGNNEALTYLVNESPIFVNTDDYGCPINFLNGGRYEEENYMLLSSYRKDGGVFLDVGANIGVYSLRIAAHRKNTIIAFEPLPRMRKLLRKSAFLNGFDIKIEPYALSNENKPGFIHVPENHTGGASVSNTGFPIELKRLDDLYPDLVVNIVKLDVEGHELEALLGMKNCLERSSPAILFEKLGIDSGIEDSLRQFADSLGYSIYYVNGNQLQKVNEFKSLAGYFMMGKDHTIENHA